MIFFIVSLIPITIYFIFKTKKVLLMFQQNRYNQNNWYFKWIIKNPDRVFGGYDLSYLLVFLLGFLINIKLLETLSIIFGIVFTLLYLRKKK